MFSDWSGWDLSNQDLSNAAFEYVNLTNADLTGAMVMWGEFV